MPEATQTLTLTGQSAELVVVSEDEDCPFTLTYSSELFQPNAPESLHVHMGAPFCAHNPICVQPVLLLPTVGERIAVDEDGKRTFTAPDGDVLEVVKNEDTETVIVFPFDLDGQVVGGQTIRQTELTLRLAAGSVVPMGFWLKAIPSMPTEFGDIDFSDVPEVIPSFTRWLQTPVRIQTQAAINFVATGEPVDMIYLAVRFRVAGSSSSTIDFASSLHSTLFTPKLSITV